MHWCSHSPMFHQPLIHVARPRTSMAIFSHSDTKSWNRLWSESNKFGENMDRIRKNAENTLIADPNLIKINDLTNLTNAIAFCWHRHWCDIMFQPHSYFLSQTHRVPLLDSLCFLIRCDFFGSAYCLLDFRDLLRFCQPNIYESYFTTT